MEEPARLNPDHYPFRDREQELFAVAAQELGDALVLAHTAVGCLAHYAWHLEIHEPEDPNQTDHVRRAAVFGISSLGIRTARALMLLVENGWEPEAHPLKRRLTECVYGRARSTKTSRARPLDSGSTGAARRRTPWHRATAHMIPGASSAPARTLTSGASE